MTLNLEDLEAVARAATPGPWTYKPTILGLPNTTVMAGDDQMGYMGVGHFLAPNATHVATFDPPTVLALIAKLREAEAVIEAARESEARTKFIAWGRKPTHEDSSHTWRILTAYKPTNQEGES